MAWKPNERGQECIEEEREAYRWYEVYDNQAGSLRVIWGRSPGIPAWVGLYDDEREMRGLLGELDGLENGEDPVRDEWTTDDVLDPMEEWEELRSDDGCGLLAWWREGEDRVIDEENVGEFGPLRWALGLETEEGWTRKRDGHL